MRYRHIQTIASHFRSALRAICLDRHDQLYAVGDAAVETFRADGTPHRRWAASRPALSVAVAADGSIYAGEAGQIERFDGAGKPLRVWHDGERLGAVTAIGFLGDSLVAADAKDRCLRRYDRAGAFLHDIGKDNRTHGFLIPNGVLDFSVDAAGVIHAANPGKHRVERYTGDGTLLGHIGRFDYLDPSGFPGCCNPTNVEVGPHGWMFVTEKAGPRAKVLAADGKLIAIVATKEFDPNCKNMDIAVDSRGRVYVADTVKLAVLVFEPAA